MKVLLKLLILVGLFYVIFLNIEFESVVEASKNLGWVHVALALLFQTLSIVVASYRWKMVVDRLTQQENTFGFFLQNYYKGMFFNQALPSSIGGDAVRVYELIKFGLGKKLAFDSVLVDRVIGLFALLLLGFISLFLVNFLPHELKLFLFIISFGAMVGFFGLMFIYKVGFIKRFSKLNFLVEISTRLNSLFRNRKSIFSILVISVLIHIFSISSLYMLAMGLGVRESYFIFLALTPIVFLASVAPISMAGWGVREGSMVALFAFALVDKTLILTASLIYGMVLIATSIVGAYFWFRDRAKV